MPSPLTLAVLLPVLVVLLTVAGLFAYIWLRYGPVVARIFEEKPLFLPLRIEAKPGEEVRFRTSDGLTLAGTYLPRRTQSRAGVVVFSHEYLSDRWGVVPYIDGLRDLGFDLFTFDYRNHGRSESKTDYEPLQWVSEYEIRDLKAALAYLRTRPDADPAGVGLFGVSRGGTTALCVTAAEPSVWGVATDGAFPIRGTMMAYIQRWAEIYIHSRSIFNKMPKWMYRFVGWAGRSRSARRLNCSFPDVERATRQIAPRPLFMIHGEKDAYISPAIARGLFDEAGDPKEIWIVPLAKHNRSRERQPEEHFARLSKFFRANAPRSISEPVRQATEVVREETKVTEPVIATTVSA
ncbi:alpha/beta fold hydrolase [Isosphaeraceae bacterium EP7]